MWNNSGVTRRREGECDAKWTIFRGCCDLGCFWMKPWPLDRETQKQIKIHLWTRRFKCLVTDRSELFSYNLILKHFYGSYNGHGWSWHCSVGVEKFMSFIIEFCQFLNFWHCMANLRRILFSVTLNSINSNYKKMQENQSRQVLLDRPRDEK